jgi:phosphoribosyl 1,2-cyclic phosphodiesterase
MAYENTDLRTSRGAVFLFWSRRSSVPFLRCGCGRCPTSPYYRVAVSRPARVTPRKVADFGYLALPLGPNVGLRFWIIRRLFI